MRKPHCGFPHFHSPCSGVTHHCKSYIVKADVDAATRSIFARYDEVDGDFSQEIAVYQAAIQAQLQILRDLGTGEIAAMTELAQLLG